MCGRCGAGNGLGAECGCRPRHRGTPEPEPEPEPGLTAPWKRPMFPLLDTPSMEECERMRNGSVLERAILELWRGRSIVSSATAARLSRDQADALLVALGEMPADHAEQAARAEDDPPHDPHEERGSDGTLHHRFGDI